MIDIDFVLSSLVSALNKAMPNSLFIRNFNIRNKPLYPYGTITVTTPYIPQTFRPHIDQNFDTNKGKIIYKRQEQPQMSLSFNVLSDNQQEAQQMCLDAISCLKFTIFDDLANKNIVVLEISNLRNLTGILVTDYEYRFQFDVRIRVESKLEKKLIMLRKLLLQMKIIKTLLRKGD